MAAKSHGLELYESETASARLIETVTGSHRFKVEGYSFDKGIGIGKYVTSPTFTIGGYDWAIRYYPDGETEGGKDYLAFYLELVSEATRVKVTFNISMLDQSKRPSKMSLASPNIFDYKGFTWGYNKFMERKTFETQHVKNNSFVVICTVTVLKSSCFESTKFEPVIVPPSDLDQQLHYLLESGEGADVTFEVGEKNFRAHKLILGTRSRVFHAQFLCEMKEKQAECIKLDNIEAEVFRVFLDFIYSDSVSKLEESIGHDIDKQDGMIMYQHLLVAADRYEVERLKLICENKLSQNIEVKNLATTLTLAEQHNCPQLKALCFKFLASANNLVAVMRTEEFDHLIQSCPYILKELAESTRNDK